MPWMVDSTRTSCGSTGRALLRVSRMYQRIDSRRILAVSIMFTCSIYLDDFELGENGIDLGFDDGLVAHKVLAAHVLQGQLGLEAQEGALQLLHRVGVLVLALQHLGEVLFPVLGGGLARHVLGGESVGQALFKLV